MKILKLIVNIFAAIFQAFIRIFIKPSQKSINGEIALITGAGHGLGQVLAVKMAALGATIVVVDINETNNRQTADMIRDAGGKAYAFTCDLSVLESIQKLAKDVKAEVGVVTILVNNAAVVYVTDMLNRTHEMITKTIRTNLLAHFRTIKEFLPDMKQNNKGHIVAISSQAAFLGVGYFPDYCATKSGIVGLMESLRRELRWDGLTEIKTTTSCPSWMNTGFAKNPTSGSELFCPVRTPEAVADETIQGILAEKPFVGSPSPTSLFLLKALFPDAVVELLVDYIRPECERTH